MRKDMHMLQRKKLAAIAVMLALAAAPAIAAEEDHSQHHPAGAPAAAATPAPTTGQAMSGGAMPGMDGGMPMMRMMGMMGMMGPGGGMPMMRMMQGHVEGRLGFLKTELKITDAQLPLWNAVADVIRANAKNGM